MKSSFPPVVNKKAKVIILGSLPGEASLAAQQYYAFPHNAFWKIMEALFDIPIGLAYANRLQRLQNARIALWDVIAAGERVGSLDAAINQATLTANDFESLFKQYRNIQHVFLNGKTVEALFKRHVVKAQNLPATMTFHVMPSTSPANARLSFNEKLQQWQLVKLLTD